MGSCPAVSTSNLSPERFAVRICDLGQAVVTEQISWGEGEKGGGEEVERFAPAPQSTENTLHNGTTDVRGAPGAKYLGKLYGNDTTVCESAPPSSVV